MILLGVTALVLTLVGLAALPFLSKLRRPDAEDEPARGRSRRGAVLIGIVLVLYAVGALQARAAARDQDRVEGAARAREADLVALVAADRSKLLAAAVFTGTGVAMTGPVPIHSLSSGEDDATVRSQVEAGRAHRCVIVTVEGAAPPRSRIRRGRC